MIKLETPLTIEKVESLHVGDQVLLSGTIYTGRDAAHKRFVEALKNNGAKIVTLGNRILRTETAGFVAASLIQYELGDLGGVVR